ncbi:MAG: hypothetical protein AAF292_13685 [Pseudomonadota bacterium]
MGYRGKSSFAALATLTVLVACSGGSAPDLPPPPPPVTNVEPVASAGPDQSGIEGDTILLNGQDSNDTDGTVASLAWRQISGPDVMLDTTSGTTTEFKVPLLSQGDTLVFELTVTDNDGATATDQVRVSVAPVSTVVEIRTEFDGEAREYSVYTPANYISGAPAVMLLHGGEGSMRELLLAGRTTFDWLALSEQAGNLLIIPNGFDQQAMTGLGDDQGWNDLRPDPAGITSQEDDEGFLIDVLEQVAAARGHDPDRVFVTGSSNGGMMSFRMLINRPEAFLGAAAFIASLPEAEVDDPATARPLMMLNGTEDRLVLFDGGPVAGNRPPTRSVQDTVDYWRRNLDAGAPTLSLLPDADPSDGCRLQLESYSSSASSDAVLLFYTAIGGGHNIPDPDTPPFPAENLARLGPFCRDANGVELAFEFFLSLL